MPNLLNERIVSVKVRVIEVRVKTKDEYLKTLSLVPTITLVSFKKLDIRLYKV